MGSFIEPTKLVGVLARVLRDTDVFESAEDVLRTVVLGGVFLEGTEGRLFGLQVVIDSLVGFASVADCFRFSARVGVVREDAVFDKHNTEVNDLLVHPFADGDWEILFEFVD